MDTSEIDNGTIESLLTEIESTDSPGKTLSGICKISQLYMDGLISSPKQKEKNELQQRTLDALMRCGTLSARAVYDGRTEVLDYVKTNILENSEVLKRYCGRNISRSRYLEGDKPALMNFRKDIRMFALDHKIDTVIAISAGGFEPAFVASIALQDCDILPIRLSKYLKSDSNVRFPESCAGAYIRDKLRGKAVLIADDSMLSGLTMRKAMEFAAANGAKEIYGTAVEILASECVNPPQKEDYKKYGDTLIFEYSER